MAAHVVQNRSGKIFLAGTGLLLGRDPDTVRAPDIGFIRNDHIPAELPEDAFWPGPPDLAVEVVSPGDTFREVDDKVQGWLDAGAMMVWVVHPRWQTVSVHRRAGGIKTLTASDVLSGEDVVPGFSCRVGDVFSQP